MTDRAARDLTPLLRPGRVALVGSLSTPRGLGSRTLRHLKSTGFKGDIVMPKDVGELTGDVDVAVVAVPSAAVPSVVARLDGRARFVIVYSAGFEETGAGALPEPRHGTTLIGPNAAGLYYGPSGTALTFANAFDTPMSCPPGSGIFLIAQSGALGARLVDMADRYGVGFDGFVATGNGTYYGACDIALDLLASAEHRPRVIAMYLESLPDGAELDAVLIAARRAAVPVVLLFGGVSSIGAHAARSHTAAVSPDGAVLRELCLMRGAAFVHSDRELVEACVGLAIAGTAAGRRVGIVTGSGGAGVVAADLLAERGLTLPALSPDVRRQLAELLPGYATTVNPVDVTASVIPDTDVIVAITGVLAASGEVDAILVVGQADHADVVCAAAGDVPVVFAALEGVAGSVAHHLAAGRPVFPGLAATCDVLAASAQCGRLDAVSGDSPGEPQARPSTAGEGLDAAASLEIVAAAGVPVAPWRRADGVGAVLAAGDELGWPVVLKANFPAGTHKAAQGGVRLNVGRTGAAEAAAELLALAPSLIVAAQLTGSPELVVGVRSDPTLGRVVVAGLGGGHVELTGRVVSVPAAASADWLAARLRDVVFDRGGERYAELPARLAEVAGALVAVAVAGGFDLVECNPLLPTAAGLVAVDARVLR